VISQSPTSYQTIGSGHNDTSQNSLSKEFKQNFIRGTSLNSGNLATQRQRNLLQANFRTVNEHGDI
jgi:hypothetical protein